MRPKQGHFHPTLILISLLLSFQASAVGEEAKERAKLQAALPEYIKDGYSYWKGIGLGKRKHVIELPAPVTYELGSTALELARKQAIDKAIKLEDSFADSNVKIDLAYLNLPRLKKNRTKIHEQLGMLQERLHKVALILDSLEKLEKINFNYVLESLDQTKTQQELEEEATAEVNRSPFGAAVSASAVRLFNDVDALKTYIQFEQNPTAFVEGFEPNAPAARGVPVLKDLLDHESKLTKRVHIVPAIREHIAHSLAEGYSAKEENALKAIEEAQRKIEETTPLIHRQKERLAAIEQDRQPAAELEAAQDAYNRSFLHFQRYFEAKYLLDEEREEQIEYLRNKLAELHEGRVRERKDLQARIEVLESLQSAEPRSFDTRSKTDSFGLEREDDVEERSAQEIAAWDVVNESDRWFASAFKKLVSNDLVFDYEGTSETKLPWVQNPTSLGLLKGYQTKITKLLAFAKPRMMEKARRVGELTREESDEALSLEKQGYDSQLARLIVKGSARDYVLVDELRDLERELEAISALTAAIDALRQPAGKYRESASERGRLTRAIEVNEQKLDDLRKHLSVSRANRNLYAYMSLASAMYDVNSKIREMRRAKASLGSVKEWRMAFLCLMHRLERLELQLAKEYRGEDPYPRLSIKTSVKDIAEYVKTSIVDIGRSFGDYATSYFSTQKYFEVQDNPTRPSKELLTLDYQWALHGTTWGQALWEKLKAFAYATFKGNYQEFLDYFTYNNLNNMLRQGADKASDINRFAAKNPILAADLMRNLTHTYLILGQMNDEGISGAIRDVKAIYQIKEVENIARDWLLGTELHLYSDDNLGEPISENTLLVIGAAEMAPYFAGALVGFMGRGTIAGWSQSFLEWIPIIGTWKPLKSVVGAAGGVAQVQAQKYLAAKISHQHELLANTLRRGFEGFFSNPPKSPTEIAKEMLAYQTGRFVIRALGTIRKIGLKEALTRAGQCVKRNAPAAIGGGAAAVVVSAAAGCAALTASAVAAPIVIPIFVAAGVFTGAVGLSDKIQDWRRPERKLARQLEQWEKNLASVDLPSAGMGELTEGEERWLDETFPKIKQNLDLKAIREKAQVEMQKTKKSLSEVMQGMLIDELNDQLVDLDLKQSENVKRTLDITREKEDIKQVADPELDKVKDKMRSIADAWERAEPGQQVPALLESAEAAVKKLETDAVTESVMQHLQDSLGLLKPKAPDEPDFVAAKKAFEFARREAEVLRVRQMETGLADTFKITQQR